MTIMWSIMTTSRLTTMHPALVRRKNMVACDDTSFFDFLLLLFSQIKTNGDVKARKN